MRRIIIQIHMHNPKSFEILFEEDFILKHTLVLDKIREEDIIYFNEWLLGGNIDLMS